jgi:hypothetical protein
MMSYSRSLRSFSWSFLQDGELVLTDGSVGNGVTCEREGSGRGGRERNVVGGTGLYS